MPVPFICIVLLPSHAVYRYVQTDDQRLHIHPPGVPVTQPAFPMIDRHVQTIYQQFQMIYQHVQTIDRHIQMIYQHVQTIYQQVQTIYQQVQMIYQQVQTIDRHIQMIYQQVQTIYQQVQTIYHVIQMIHQCGSMIWNRSGSAGIFGATLWTERYDNDYRATRLYQPVDPTGIHE